MEIHHHAHTSRKKWTHYLWEFLMLFFAVFCGFLAENQREHLVEKKREKQYMQSLVEDLQKDTLDISDDIELGIAQLGIANTQMIIINTGVLTDKNIERLYLLHFSARLVGPYFEDRTSAQLKNAGGLRLVHERTVADSISNYWRSIKVCETMTQLYEDYSKKIADLGVTIFNNKYVIKSTTWDPPSAVLPGARFIRNDPELLAEYSNSIMIKRNLLRMFIERMDRTKSRAVGLMEIIRNKYHLN